MKCQMIANNFKARVSKYCQVVFTKVTINVITIVSVVDNFFCKYFIEAPTDVIIGLTSIKYLQKKLSTTLIQVIYVQFNLNSEI